MTVRVPSESKIEMSMTSNSHAEILIVDDDALSRKILAQVLASAGYNCQVCGDGPRHIEVEQQKRRRLRYAWAEWRGGAKTASLGSVPGSRTGAGNHVDRARKRGKRNLLLASWRR